MSEPFLSEIRMFGFTFPPRGHADCDGQIMPINQYQALYSLLGTTYGGDGRTTFGLPDLRGRSPMHAGSGPGGNVRLGQRAGAEKVTLTVAQIPNHTHALNVNSKTGTTDEPDSSTYIAGAGSDVYGPYVDPKVTLNADASAAAGGGQGHENMQPFLVIRFCIVLTGLFPSRN